MDYSDITDQQTNTGSLRQRQDGHIGMPESTTTKQTRIPEGVATFAVLDECQQKTACSEGLATADTINGYIFDTPVNCDSTSQEACLPSLGYQQAPVSGSSQQPIAWNLVTEKGGAGKQRPHLNKPRGTVEPYRRLQDLTLAKRYKYTAVEKLKVDHYSKPVYICVAILFIISMGCMANIWILQCEVNRLEDEMRKRGPYLEDHTWMEKGGVLIETEDKAMLHDDFKHLSGALHLQPVTPSDVIQLSRGVRRANDPPPAPDDPAPAGGKSRSKAKSKSKGKANGKKKRKKKGKGKNVSVRQGQTR